MIWELGRAQRPFTSGSRRGRDERAEARLTSAIDHDLLVDMACMCCARSLNRDACRGRSVCGDFVLSRTSGLWSVITSCIHARCYRGLDRLLSNQAMNMTLALCTPRSVRIRQLRGKRDCGKRYCIIWKTLSQQLSVGSRRGLCFAQFNTRGRCFGR